MQYLFLGFGKLIEYLASAVTAVPSNPCIGPSLRTKIYIFSIIVCVDELLSAVTFLSKSKCGIEKRECESSPMLYPE